MQVMDEPVAVTKNELKKRRKRVMQLFNYWRDVFWGGLSEADGKEQVARSKGQGGSNSSTIGHYIAVLAPLLYASAPTGRAATKTRVCQNVNVILKIIQIETSQ